MRDPLSGMGRTGGQYTMGLGWVQSADILGIVHKDYRLGGGQQVA